MTAPAIEELATEPSNDHLTDEQVEMFRAGDEPVASPMDPTFLYLVNFNAVYAGFKKGVNFGNSIKTPTLDKITELAAAYAMRLTEIELMGGPRA